MRGLFVIWCLRAIDYEACGFVIPLNPLSVRPHTTELTTQINCVSKTEETREIITKMVNALDDHVIEARNRSSSLYSIYRVTVLDEFILMSLFTTADVHCFTGNVLGIVRCQKGNSTRCVFHHARAPQWNASTHS